jgi:hypothetical protein
VERYEFRRDLAPLAAPRGKAVAYSTDGESGYAPFRGVPGCISRSGRPRSSHDFDRDGRCFWCEEQVSA